MRKAGSQKIDGVSYNIAQLPPRQAQMILIKVLKVLGEPIGSAIGTTLAGGKKKSVLQQKADKWIAEVLPKLFEKIGEDDVEEVVDTLLSSANKTLDSAEFQGKLMHMYKVVAACAEVNFSDFFDDAVAVFLRLGELAATIRGNATSSGGSGDPSSQDSQPSRKLRTTGA